MAVIVALRKQKEISDSQIEPLKKHLVAKLHKLARYHSPTAYSSKQGSTLSSASGSLGGTGERALSGSSTVGSLSGSVSKTSGGLLGGLGIKQFPKIVQCPVSNGRALLCLCTQGLATPSRSRQGQRTKPVAVRLTSCQREPYRKPVGIDDRMNLAGQPAS